MEITSQSIVSEIVEYNYKTAQVFENKRINFCCGGNKPLGQACMEAGISVDEIIQQIQSLEGNFYEGKDYYEKLTLNELCDYIEEKYHCSIESDIPFIIQKIIKLCNSHGHKHNEVFSIRSLFQEIAEQLSSHVKKGELMLFPYIKNLIKAKEMNSKAPKPIFENLHDLADDFQMEHSSIEKLFNKVAELTRNYTKPKDGCNTFEVTYRKLEEFNNQINEYNYIETNILYPKVIRLDQALSQN